MDIEKLADKITHELMCMPNGCQASMLTHVGCDYPDWLEESDVKLIVSKCVKEYDESEAALTDALNKVCKHVEEHLKEGWSIELWLSRQSCEVSLIDEDGEDVHVDVDSGDSLIAAMCRYSQEVGIIEIPPEPTHRPFLPEELPRIVGRRVRNNETSIVLILNSAHVGKSYLDTGFFKLWPDELYNDWQFLDFDGDGNEVVTPCGVLVTQEGGDV